MNSFKKFRISILTDHLIEEKITDDEFKELESLIQKSESCAKWYKNCISTQLDIHHFNFDDINLENLSHKNISNERTLSLPKLVACFLIGSLILGFLFQNEALKENLNPVIKNQKDKISIIYKDGSELVLSKNSTFSMPSHDHIMIVDGDFVATRPEVENKRTHQGLNISIGQNKIKLKRGKLAYQTKPDGNELRIHDAEADLFQNHESSQIQLEPGRLYSASDREVKPKYFNESTFLSSNFKSSYTKLYSDFEMHSSSLDSNWAQNWQVRGQQDSKFFYDIKSPLFKTTGRYFNFFSSSKNLDQEVSLPTGNKRELKKGFESQFITTYQSSESLDITQKHCIELLLRINSNPNDLLRFSILDANEIEENEPIFFHRTWSIVAGYPKFHPQIKDFSWFVHKKEDTHSILKIDQGMTYSLLIEIDPINRKAKTVISNGVETIHNIRSNRSKLPSFGKKRKNLSGIVKFIAYAKPGTEVDISIDEMLIRNYDNEHQKNLFVNNY